MELGELVSLYRRQAGITIDELVEKSGVPKGTITKIIGGVTKAPTLENMKAIAKALNKRLADFDDEPAMENFLSTTEHKLIEKYRDLDPYGKETIDIALKRESERVASLREQEKLIKELKEKQLSAVELSEESQHQGRIIQYFQRVSAGTGLIINEDGDTEHITIPDVRKYKRVGYAVKVCGNSMEDLYHDGDMLLVEPTCTVDVNEIGIFNVDGQAFVKKRGETELISLNPDCNNIPFTNSTKCMGRVIDKFIAD